MKDKCPNVDSATTFFKSSSKTALDPATFIVKSEAIRRKSLTSDPPYRISRYTPAVTSVDECTKDETGVGALIAAGNHALKGN
uniref:Uncharacterized protein n=1 Tax=Pinctada fucata TaxID=50426 RepID=A0A194AL72_PINFU